MITAGGSGMQPVRETTETRTNGPVANGPPDASPESGPARHGNGATPFEYDLLHALQAMRVGDFSVRMAGDQDGVLGKIADTFNEIAGANQRIAQQLERVGQEVGREGKTRQRVKFALSK